MLEKMVRNSLGHLGAGGRSCFFAEGSLGTFPSAEGRRRREVLAGGQVAEEGVLYSDQTPVLFLGQQIGTAEIFPAGGEYTFLANLTTSTATQKARNLHLLGKLRARGVVKTGPTFSKFPPKPARVAKSGDLLCENATPLFLEIDREKGNRQHSQPGRYSRVQPGLCPADAVAK